MPAEMRADWVSVAEWMLPHVADRPPPGDGGLPVQGREMAPSIDAEGNLWIRKVRAP